MSAFASGVAEPASEPQAAAGPARSRSGAGQRRRVSKRRTSLFANSEPMVWLTGASLVVCLAMILGLLALVLYQGTATFWPVPLVKVQTHAGKTYLGEVNAHSSFAPGDEVYEALGAEAAATARAQVAQQGGVAERRMLRTGNFEITGEHFTWISDFEVAAQSEPEWALVLERQEWGRFYGEPKAFLIDGQPQATAPESVWRMYEEQHDAVRDRWQERVGLETHETGVVNGRIEDARLALRSAELEHGVDSVAYSAAARHLEDISKTAEVEFQALRARIDALNAENQRYQLLLETAQGDEVRIPLDQIVRAYPANRITTLDALGIYLSRWGEFLVDVPREANSEGGVFPAIFGTVVMTMLMSLLVVPFGVLAALYLREYARPGPLVSFVRISVNNLAGVPSIVFGVFGLGFFCYILGGGIDSLFYAERLPNPTFGKGGILWASFTLALLTLPVVIVATEEALAAVPGSMREGSYACGATKWQTIQRIVLPRAMPGIMTGFILAIARGAGEVAPLMLVGAVKIANELPISMTAPFLHPERNFMHLGFQIYDLGFQSQNSEAAKPMVFTTTMLLIAIIITLNFLAVWIRARLRNRFAGGTL